MQPAYNIYCLIDFRTKYNYQKFLLCNSGFIPANKPNGMYLLEMLLINTELQKMKIWKISLITYSVAPLFEEARFVKVGPNPSRIQMYCNNFPLVTL